jgi:hypothetical protein
MPRDTGSEKFLRVLDSVILRRSRRIWLPKKMFLSLATQILRFTQDDKWSARISPNPYECPPPGNARDWLRYAVSDLESTGGTADDAT